jgi:hypothetical protein
MKCPFRCYWFAAIGKAALFRSAFLGSFFGRSLTGTNTPFEISSERMAAFLASMFYKLNRSFSFFPRPFSILKKRAALEKIFPAAGDRAAQTKRAVKGKPP